MSYRIASFNMYNFSLRSDLTIKKDLDLIAKIIKDNNIDIIAMQEVLAAGRSLVGIQLKNNPQNKLSYEKSLLSRLGKDWESYWDCPKPRSKYYPYLGSDSRNEGYAFLWNKKKFELLKNEFGNDIKPKIYGHYHILPDQMRLIRDPLYGRFRIKGTKTELRLITTHIIYGKPKDENIKDEYNFDIGSIAMRKNEFEVLAGKIYSGINDYRKDTNFTVPYTIILGDYNLNLESSDTKSKHISDIAFFDSRGRQVSEKDNAIYKIYTCQNLRSSLGKDDYANNYDHFSFDDHVNRLVSCVERVDGVGKYINKSGTEEERFADFKNKVSDHVPIILEIDLRKKL